MTFYPFILDFVIAACLQESFPKVWIQCSLFIIPHPAVVAPALRPSFLKSTEYVGRVTPQSDETSLLQCFEANYSGHQLHAAIRGTPIPAAELFSTIFVSENDGIPSWTGVP